MPSDNKRTCGQSWRVLREEPRFRLLLAAGLVSGIGNWFNTVALLSLLLALTGSGLAVGITLALRTLPQLVLGPLAGVLADHLPRKRILLAADLVNTLLALSFLLVTTPDRVWLAYAATAAMVAAGTLRAPARAAAIPSLVRAENLLGANALDQAVQGLVMVAGAVLGGVVAAALGVSAAFILNAASFALSALLILPIAFPALAGARKKPGLAALAEVWPLIRGSRLLWALLLLAVLWPLGGAVINVLLSIYAVRVFGAGDLGVGVLYGAVGVGLLLGGLFAHRLARWERWVPIAAFALEGSGHMLASQAPNLALAAVAIAVATAAAGVGNACFSSLLMRAVPGHLLGRVYALQGTLASVTFGLSLLVSGALLAVAPPRLMGLCAGALIVLAALLGGALMRTAELPVAVPATTAA